MNATPPPARMIIGAIATLLLAIVVWVFVEWRSAPPPPPQVALPDLPAKP